MPRRLPPDHGARTSAGALAKLTPEQRQARARLGALVQWSKTEDWTQRSQPARDGYMRRFHDEVDPDRRLSPEQREKQARMAMRAHLSRAAQASAKARAARKAGVS